jgi:hypothetical protein
MKPTASAQDDEFVVVLGRAKATATTTTKADPFGMTIQKK